MTFIGPTRLSIQWDVMSQWRPFVGDEYMDDASCSWRVTAVEPAVNTGQDNRYLIQLTREIPLGLESPLERMVAATRSGHFLPLRETRQEEGFWEGLLVSSLTELAGRDTIVPYARRLEGSGQVWTTTGDRFRWVANIIRPEEGSSWIRVLQKGKVHEAPLHPICLNARYMPWRDVEMELSKFVRDYTPNTPGPVSRFDREEV